MTRIYLYPFLFIITISLFLSNGYTQNCPSLNVVGSFNNIVSWPTNFATAQSNGHCFTFTPPYASTLCFEYQVPFSDTVLFSLHLNACGSTSSINTGNYGGGCSGTSSSNATFTGTATYDANCNLIGNSAFVGYCGGAVSGDILTICFSINTATICEPITICPTAFCGASSCQTTLPISLLSFNGHCFNGKNYLKWSTASEINNDYFTIEKSNDGIFFEPVAFIPGAGNSNEVINYEYKFLSENKEKISYYRLKQTDFDGTFTYSEIIAVTCDETQTAAIFPNPANNIVSINAVTSIKTVSIINYLQQVIMSKTTELVKQTNIDVSSFSKGIYVLQVEMKSGEMFTEKLIIN